MMKTLTFAAKSVLSIFSRENNRQIVSTIPCILF